MLRADLLATAALNTFRSTRTAGGYEILIIEMRTVMLTESQKHIVSFDDIGNSYILRTTFRAILTGSALNISPDSFLLRQKSQTPCLLYA